jgi:broad specificity phosphatase PhoE
MTASALHALDSVEVLLVRHGRTAWNVERRFLGRTNVPLDEVGRAQAERVGARLRPLAPVAIYTSPLLRARHTAEAVGSAVDVPGLVEMDMGALEGLSGPECLERHPEVLAQWRVDPSGVHIPGGETLADVQARVIVAFRELVAAHRPGDRIVVVTHQLALASLLCALAERPLAGFNAYGHQNGAFATLRVGAGGVEIVRVDEADHLV